MRVFVVVEISVVILIFIVEMFMLWEYLMRSFWWFICLLVVSCNKFCVINLVIILFVIDVRVVVMIVVLIVVIIDVMV